MIGITRVVAILAQATLVTMTTMAGAAAQNAECASCHAAVVKKATVHAATGMGCALCHSDIDASATPHRNRGQRPKGLAADMPGLCIKCHEARLFEGKVTHAPVATGNCLGCHEVHASEHQGLLKKEPATLCLDCHPDTKKGPHVIAGFSRSGHPLGNDKKRAEDPLRPGKAFYCASCHEPHRSERPRLNRFERGMGSCQKCHKI